MLVMEPAQPLRFGGVISKDAARVPRRLIRQVARPQKPKRPEQQLLARSSQQPLARSRGQPEPRQCSRNRAFTQLKSNSGGARQPNLNLSQKRKQTPTFTLFPPPRAAQKKVAARKARSQIQARTTPRVAKMSMQAAEIERKRSQPLAQQKPDVAQKRKAPPLTPAAAQCEFRKVFDGKMSETQHLAYHSGYKGFCIRCDMQKRRKVYEACARHEGGSWLATGVRNGLWGLGCTECARFLASGRQRLDNAKFSKFANFTFRPRCGFHGRGHIERHSKIASHRLACGLNRHRPWCAPSQSEPKRAIRRSPRPRLLLTPRY